MRSCDVNQLKNRGGEALTLADHAVGKLIETVKGVQGQEVDQNEKRQDHFLSLWKTRTHEKRVSSLEVRTEG
jgi:hypothetical protein